MDVRDFLEKVDEKQVQEFLNSCFGEENIDSVIKFFDESYNGYVFRVQMPNGVDLLPKEDGDALRLGAYGFIRDDLEVVVPLAFDDMVLSTEYPEFLKKYVLFMKEQTENLTLNGQDYLYKFQNVAFLELLLNRNNPKNKIDFGYKIKKNFIYNLVKNAEEQELE